MISNVQVPHSIVWYDPGAAESTAAWIVNRPWRMMCHSIADKTTTAISATRETLLVRRGLVSGEENFETVVLGTFEKLAVLQPRPTLVAHRKYLMPPRELRNRCGRFSSSRTFTKRIACALREQIRSTVEFERW